ncbi:DNA-binding transcriptional regulator, LysR family [Paraburkholderia steynii]|uniref:DNA-binding transcriptional regulator, LysR family n=1 Tax=Paraburkholderia steynii TaxID=1245441 RepID=A0A7Z7BB52_9BURK|nr:LysR family transcriptional regulator [Paraburkholderia steynii]SDI51826.1 DNA-binding transcriptional regulator, LysR family [Paraburkholderia steynii]
MLDALSLDQLRTFIVAAEEGSFSAAARKMFRAQSAISDLISKLEGQIGVVLFDRSGRYPKLTPEGLALLADAKKIVASVDDLKARAKEMSAGLEPELAVVVDVFFPMDGIAATARDFRNQFPRVSLRLHTEALCGAYQAVSDGRAAIGVVPTSSMTSPEFKVERLMGVGHTIVVATGHPLAMREGRVSRPELAQHTQLVLSDGSRQSANRELGAIMSPSTWHLTDLFAKRAFLLNGVGWGGMPAHTISTDIAEGRLVRLDIEDSPTGDQIIEMSAICPIARPPGPAGRWFIERLREWCLETPRESNLQ